MTEVETLLNTYKSNLNTNGCFRESGDVSWLINKMRVAVNLVDKYILLHILQITCKSISDLPNDDNGKSKQFVEKFLNQGGWSVLNSWLMDFMNNKNYAFASVILKVLLVIPVNLAILKQGNVGKLVKKASKISYQDMSSDALKLIETWKSLILLPSSSDSPGTDQQSVYNGELTESQNCNEKRKKEKLSSGRIMLIDPLPSNGDSTVKREEKSDNTTLSGRSTNSSTNLSTNSRNKTLLDEIIESQSNLGFVSTKKVIDSNTTKPQQSSGAVISSSKSVDSRESPPIIKKTPKKSVRWKADDSLVEIKVYELFEEERKSNIPHDHGDFSQARHQELLHEAMAIKQAKNKITEEKLNSKWRKPTVTTPFDSLLVKTGESSLERDIQRKRESEIVAVLYFKPEQIPISADESDVDMISSLNSSSSKSTPSRDGQPPGHGSEQPSLSEFATDSETNESSSSRECVLIPVDIKGEMNYPEWPSDYWINYVMDNHRNSAYSSELYREHNSDAFSGSDYPQQPPYYTSSGYENKPINSQFQGPPTTTRGKYNARGAIQNYNSGSRFPHSSRYGDEGRQVTPMAVEGEFPYGFRPSRLTHGQEHMRDHPPPKHYPHPEEDVLQPPTQDRYDEHYHPYHSYENDSYQPNPSHHSSFHRPRGAGSHFPRGSPPFAGNARHDPHRSGHPSSHKTVCRHFVGRGCRNGSSCRFFHPPM